MRKMPRGLMVIGVVLAAAAAVQAFQDTEKPANNCTVCASMSSCPGMMDGSVKSESYNIQNGVAMLFTVSDPAKAAEFHQGWDQCKAEMDKVMKWSKSEAQSHLCTMCQGYYTLSHEGAQWDYVKTENGVLCLLTSKKAKVVTAIQTQAAACREAMKNSAACATPESTTAKAEKEGNPEPPEKEADPSTP
jgi:hypothetical protein